MRLFHVAITPYLTKCFTPLTSDLSEHNHYEEALVLTTTNRLLVHMSRETIFWTQYLQLES